MDGAEIQAFTTDVAPSGGGKSGKALVGKFKRGPSVHRTATVLKEGMLLKWVGSRCD